MSGGARTSRWAVRRQRRPPTSSPGPTGSWSSTPDTGCPRTSPAPSRARSWTRCTPRRGDSGRGPGPGKLPGERGTPLPRSGTLALAQRPFRVLDDEPLRLGDQLVAVPLQSAGDAVCRAPGEPGVGPGVERGGRLTAGRARQRDEPVTQPRPRGAGLEVEVEAVRLRFLLLVLQTELSAGARAHPV